MGKNILLINRNCTSNLGDQKIAETIKKLFDIKNVNVDIAKYSEFFGKKMICQKSNKNNDSFLQKLKKNICTISYIKEFKCKIDNKSMINILKNKNYDYIILGNGELIQLKVVNFFLSKYHIKFVNLKKHIFPVLNMKKLKNILVNKKEEVINL
mgnify:FL=1